MAITNIFKLKLKMFGNLGQIDQQLQRIVQHLSNQIKNTSTQQEKQEKN